MTVIAFVSIAVATERSVSSVSIDIQTSGKDRLNFRNNRICDLPNLDVSMPSVPDTISTVGSQPDRGLDDQQGQLSLNKHGRYSQWTQDPALSR